MTAIALLSGCVFLFAMVLSAVAWNCHFIWLAAKSWALKELVIVLIVLTRGEVWEEIHISLYFPYTCESGISDL